MSHQFNCPTNNCNMQLFNSSSEIAEHIKMFHPDIYRYLKFPVHVYRCNECEKYTNKQHHHSNIWSLESFCNKMDCKRFGCSLNHSVAGSISIDDDSHNICSDDKPWEDKRCMNPMCRKDHFEGHLRHLLKMQNEMI